MTLFYPALNDAGEPIAGTCVWTFVITIELPRTAARHAVARTTGAPDSAS